MPDPLGFIIQSKAKMEIKAANAGIICHYSCESLQESGGNSKIIEIVCLDSMDMTMTAFSQFEEEAFLEATESRFDRSGLERVILEKYADYLVSRTDRPIIFWKTSGTLFGLEAINSRLTLLGSRKKIPCGSIKQFELARMIGRATKGKYQIKMATMFAINHLDTTSVIEGVQEPEYFRMDRQYDMKVSLRQKVKNFLMLYENLKDGSIVLPNSSKKSSGWPIKTGICSAAITFLVSYFSFCPEKFSAKVDFIKSIATIIKLRG